MPALDPTPPSCLDVRTATRSGRRVLTPVGELDTLAAPALHERLSEELDRLDRAELEVDLSEVTFLDSAALTVLVTAHQRARRTGCVLQVRPGTARAVTRPLAITGLSTVFCVTGG